MCKWAWEVVGQSFHYHQPIQASPCHHSVDSRKQIFLVGPTLPRQIGPTTGLGPTLDLRSKWNCQIYSFPYEKKQWLKAKGREMGTLHPLYLNIRSILVPRGTLRFRFRNTDEFLWRCCGRRHSHRWCFLLPMNLCLLRF